MELISKTNSTSDMSHEVSSTSMTNQLTSKNVHLGSIVGLEVISNSALVLCTLLQVRHLVVVWWTLDCLASMPYAKRQISLLSTFLDLCWKVDFLLDFKGFAVLWINCSVCYQNHFSLLGNLALPKCYYSWAECCYNQVSITAALSFHLTHDPYNPYGSKKCEFHPTTDP